MQIKPRIQNYLNEYRKAAPLAVFRIFFGILMLVSMFRFWANGWIEKLYLEPGFFFSYYGFEFVRPLGGWTYLFFIVCGLSALAIAIGYRYRLAMVVFFLSFTYIELMDKTTYLNHYYFVSILSFLLIFLPANAQFSVDAFRNPRRAFGYVPRWTIDAIKLLLTIVYLYAGLAKLNSDWLIEAMPLKIWLPGRYDIPLLGSLFHREWVIYAFAWGGALYDLLIPFLLWNRSTRFPAFLLVIVFHVLTRVLFPIGMFPYIMIFSATIFFSDSIHERFLRWLGGLLRIPAEVFSNSRELVYSRAGKQLRTRVLAVFFGAQLLIPFRYLAYSGELFWTEQGYRFSWRVMLMEKAGYAQFRIVHGEAGEKSFSVDNGDFLTAFQEKQMATQPDFILEYAHFLRDHYQKKGYRNIEVYVDSYVAMNGRPSSPYIDPTVNLAALKPSLKHKDWILPFHDEIKGF